MDLLAYRTQAPLARVSPEGGGADRELLPVVVLLWLASGARVWGAFRGGETFGAEPSMALLLVLGLPLLFWPEKRPNQA